MNDEAHALQRRRLQLEARERVLRSMLHERCTRPAVTPAMLVGAAAGGAVLGLFGCPAQRGQQTAPAAAHDWLSRATHGVELWASLMSLAPVLEKYWTGPTPDDDGEAVP